MKPATLRRLTRTLAVVAARVVAGCVLVVVTVLLVVAFGDRSMPELQPWHRAAPAGEFRAGDAHAHGEFDLADYLLMERRLFDGLGDFAVSPDDPAGYSRAIRYVAGGLCDPDTFDRNWNRTFELVPQEIRGGALLVHGLSDSPYSMRSLATLLYDQGYYVLAMRMPGHGTVPAALLDVSWQDWTAAIEIGARHVTAQLGEDQPFIMGGYSNGGALVVLYTLSALADDDLPAPDRVILMSPAIGITRFAMASNWQKLFSWIPYFEKSRWVSLQPEYDPFKYNSFPKNAGALSWAVTRRVQAGIERAAANGRLQDMPPILTFQSIVDSTIIAQDVIDKLYRRLPDNGSELVVFDINSVGELDGFYRARTVEAKRLYEADTTMPFRLTLITNASPESRTVVARTKTPFSAEVLTEPLELAWPEQVYSLAHVSIPFPPDDPLYGPDGSAGHANLGSLAPRGEKNVLNIAASDLLRLRYNPFHGYMARRILEVVAPTEP